ncbi:DUF397 domain-containing protein [Lentzea sp. BCCO 10_0856]|uniref:DUF397 domain-containing protein n=1 Tax=Lentzea miocenica TaxID=3095431 RepID=A0ABU4TBP8_9PSEU|nr:DUF397 domain-containing protein [Lentzea sp. BCCO 10_0856]MDX8035596.1 DUF397 domain-containing protein [Lentzea sp. BCCO 10_0856]
MAAELRWKRSSYSGGDANTCVECAGDGRAVRIRDSKDRRRLELHVATAGWRAFLAFARS